MPPEPETASLSADQAEAVRRVLKRAGVTATAAAAILEKCVAATLSQYHPETVKRRDAPSSREIHDELRKLWRFGSNPTRRSG